MTDGLTVDRCLGTLWRKMALDAGPFMRTRTRGSPSWPTISHRKAGYVFADCSVHPTQTACRRGGPYVCATGAAVGLDVAAIDLTGLGDPAFLRQRRQDARPGAPAAPPVPAIVDRRRRAVFRRTIGPAATAFEHVNDARDHPAIIDPSCPGLVCRHGQTSISPPVMTLPWTWAMVGLGMLRQRSERPK